MLCTTPPRTGSRPPAPHTHAECSDLFRALLDAAGWNATRARGSLEWQTHRRFESVLDELATLDFDGSRVTPAQALTELTRLARTALFAPESSLAPVQVLGPLELGRCPLRCPVVPGARAILAACPPPSALAASLLAPAACTWRARHGQRTPIRPQPPREWPPSHALRRRPSSASPWRRKRAISAPDRRPARPPARSLERHQRRTLPPPPRPFEEVQERAAIPPPRTPPARRAHACWSSSPPCGFRAFAELRLASEEPDRREPGLNAMERGNLVHAVMEHFWAELEDQQQLNALSAGEREQHLDACIRHAPPKGATRSEDPRGIMPISPRSTSACSTCSVPGWRWKPPGREFRVRVREQRAGNVPLGPLLLTLRPDRIDETAEGPRHPGLQDRRGHPFRLAERTPRRTRSFRFTPSLPRRRSPESPLPSCIPAKVSRSKALPIQPRSSASRARMPLPMDQQLAEWHHHSHPSRHRPSMTASCR